MVNIKCKNSDCEYEWDYSGKSRFYASCPMCRRVAKLQKIIPPKGEGSILNEA